MPKWRKEKLPSHMPNKPDEMNQVNIKQPVLYGPYPNEINPESRLDRDYDSPTYDRIRILPPEIKEQLLKLTASTELPEQDVSDVYEYLLRLVQDGVPFEEALQKAYENLWPKEVEPDEF